MTEPPSDKAEAHSTLLAWLDSSGGLLDAMANALHAAKEAGHHVESDEDRLADVDAHLQQAAETVFEDGLDADHDEVLDLCSGAASHARRFHRGLDEDVENFEIPDHVDSGVYDTVGDFAEYLYKDCISIKHKAEMYAEAAA